MPCTIAMVCFFVSICFCIPVTTNSTVCACIEMSVKIDKFIRVGSIRKYVLYFFVQTNQCIVISLRGQIFQNLCSGINDTQIPYVDMSGRDQAFCILIYCISIMIELCGNVSRFILISIHFIHSCVMMYCYTYCSSCAQYKQSENC